MPPGSSSSRRPSSRSSSATACSAIRRARSLPSSADNPAACIYHTYKTYYHGQAGAVYKQHAPLVNACRPPGEWQAYDIIYHAPCFDDAGKLLQPATVTILQNGVLIQDHVEIMGPTASPGKPKYQAHPLKQPLALQDHHNPIRFRNIWIREL